MTKASGRRLATSLLAALIASMGFAAIAAETPSMQGCKAGAPKCKATATASQDDAAGQPEPAAGEDAASSGAAPDAN